MKRLVITLTLIITIQYVSAQRNLTLRELVSFVKKSNSEINNELMVKSWQFLDTRKDRRYYISSWALDMDKDSTAAGWLTVKFKQGYFNIVTYQCQSVSAYTKILSEIKELGLKAIPTTKSEGDILTTRYEGKSYKYDIYTQGRTHEIVVYHSLDYFRMVKDDTNSYNLVDTIPADTLHLDNSEVSEFYNTKIKPGYRVFLYEKMDYSSKVIYTVKEEDDILVMEKGALFYVKIEDHYGFVNPISLQVK